MNRRLFIVMAVIGFHVLGLWALQAGLLRRAVELVIPVNVLAEFIEAPQPQVTPTPPPPEPRPEPVQKQRPVPKPAPQPMAIAEPKPAPASEAPSGTTQPPPAAEPLTASMNNVETPPAPPAPPKIEPPSSNAAFLGNPKAPYPQLSERLGEEGTVWIRAYIEPNGTASKADVSQSSGYARLDQTALQTALKWRYVPGKRAGVPEAMWVTIPIHFVIE
ncbi:energy transducer TonB [Hydrogenophaga taeniospiralis]|uniref:energy transducer TonB n=1 Tax=Hydrogenophaga taeniospiralis TaxID=65656 RepID=UPI001CFA2A08|nr:energy transducer TonB [Hydrogenophaga taeniospiralis]MCB4364936.1 energy transducer TonB [Hydrogenophaga taeniospiralis]